MDSTCTRDSYGITLKGTSGTAKDITFSCDSGTHYVEFCYSKDGSVNILQTALQYILNRIVNKLYEKALILFKY